MEVYPSRSSRALGLARFGCPMNLMFHTPLTVQRRGLEPELPQALRDHCFLQEQELGVLALTQIAYKEILRQLQAISPLRIATYGRAASLESVLPWKQAQVSCVRGLADSGPVEATFHFRQWGAVFAVLSTSVAPPGIYVYDKHGQLSASVTLAAAQQLPDFLELVYANRPRRAASKARVSSCSLATPRAGFGPRTHADSSCARILSCYAKGDCLAIERKTSLRSVLLSPQEASEAFDEMARERLELSLVCGHAAFWQLHECVVRPTLQPGSSLRLRGANCTATLRLDETSEIWLVRSHFQGNFIYSIVAYDTDLELDFVALLPRAHIAASVSDWRSLIRGIGATLIDA